MRLALLADIHSNLQALQSVLLALSGVRVDRVVYLGDLVGYNANPTECIALARERFDRIVQGNHDREVSGSEPIIGTSSVARIAQQWTQAQLAAGDVEWLACLPNKDVEDNSYMAVHGCFLNEGHVNGYITQTMLAANLQAIASRDDWPSIGFCGHTHIPMLAWLKRGDISYTPLSGVQSWPGSAEAVLINPGSVGQPRDADPSASFAVVDLVERTVELQRIEYDVAGAAAAVLAAGLPERLAARLGEGR